MSIDKPARVWHDLRHMERPAHLTALNYLSVFAFLFFLGLCTWKIAGAPTDGAPTTLLVVGVLFLAYLAADFLSGFVHFLGDSFGDVNTPIVGKTFIFPFREHHVDQKAITRHDFFETNGHNCLVSLPVLLFIFFTFPPGMVSPLVFASYLFLFALVLFVFCTNQFHKWAHEDEPNRIARWLQSKNIILTPTRHKKHHTFPYENHFCITTGWLNHFLETIRFFPFAKWALAKVPGMPKIYEPHLNKKDSP